MNPLTSPWNTPPLRKSNISDQQLYFRWSAIKKHLTTTPDPREGRGIICILLKNNTLYLAKNSQKMRLKSHLDWAYYTPKTLAQALDADIVETYYEIMLNDVRSDPNIWKDKDIEMELKSFYAARANRASLI